jgi:hypothetical protein
MIIPELPSTKTALDNFQSDNSVAPFKNSFYAGNIGLECPKRQWLTFINAYTETISNKTLRIFARGLREESYFVKILQDIGVEVIYPDESNKDDFKVDYLNGLVRGKIDAIALSGVKESPDKPHILEFKTMNNSSFNDLQKNGLEKFKAQHYYQIQFYMLSKNIDRGLYLAINKDNDELYVERVKLERNKLKEVMRKVSAIVLNKNNMPPAISEEKSFFKCKMCPAQKVCHGDEMPGINCRTCVFSKTSEDGQFYCNYWLKVAEAKKPITIDFQKKGCNRHFYIPSLLKKLNVMSTNTETNLNQDLDDPNEYYFIWHFEGGYIKVSLKDGLRSADLFKIGYDILISEDFLKLRDSFGVTSA